MIDSRKPNKAHRQSSHMDLVNLSNDPGKIAGEIASNVNYGIASLRGSKQIATWLLPLNPDPLKSILRMNRTTTFVEIGVGDGSGLRNFLSESEGRNIDCVEYHGFDTFADGLPEEEISNNGINEKIEIDREQHFTSRETIKQIPKSYTVNIDMKLYKGLSTDTVPEAVNSIQSADVIHIDGGIRTKRLNQISET